ncbi:MAG: stage III sporulation protein AD [Ruminococcus sp.]|nr:stage III sporulation protein AD [Ruminococcus sp.]
MNIISITMLGVLTALLSLSIRRYNAEISLIIAIAGCVIIFLSVLLSLSSAFETVKSILATAYVSTEYIVILLKAVGICFLTEFACDCCTDAGQRALAGNVSLAGKILVLVTTIPLYQDILNTVLSLTGGAV